MVDKYFILSTIKQKSEQKHQKGNEKGEEGNKKGGEESGPCGYQGKT